MINRTAPALQEGNHLHLKASFANITERRRRLQNADLKAASSTLVAKCREVAFDTLRASLHGFSPNHSRALASATHPPSAPN